MKTFNDLEFIPHEIGDGIRATLKFPNGYGVSVIQGPLFYTEGDDEYELAVTNTEGLCYNTNITNDVLGHLSPDEVTEVMKQVQELKGE